MGRTVRKPQALVSARIVGAGLGWALLIGAGLLTQAQVAEASNTPPVARDDQIKVNGFDAILIDVLANDSDADGDPLTVTILSGGSGLEVLENGILRRQGGVCHAEPQFVTYEVDDGRTGTSTATLTLVSGHCLDNLPPSCVGEIWTTAVNTPTEVPVLENDSDPDGDPLVVARVAEFQHGTGHVTADGLRVYFEPEPGFSGPGATFKYWVSDGRHGEASATTSIAVIGSQGQGAVDDLVATAQNKILVLPAAELLANDDPGLTFFGASSNSGDRVEVISPPGGDAYLLYFPPQGLIGSRSFWYSATNAAGVPSTAEVVVTIFAPTTSMRATDDALETERGGCLTVDRRLLAEDDFWSGEETPVTSLAMEPILGSLTEPPGSNGPLWSYTAPAGAATLDAFQYGALDQIAGTSGGGSSDVATVTMDLRTPGSLPHPVAQVDLFETQVTTVVQLDVLKNDYDPGCQALTLTAVWDDTEVKASVLRVLSNGKVEYQPFGSATGEDRFFYRVRNAAGFERSGEVAVQLRSSVPEPWPRFEYRDCDDLSTCIVDGSASWDATANRPWSFVYTPAGTQTCDEYWHFEGVNPPYPPPVVPCDQDSRDEVQRLEDRYTAPGMNLVDLTLWENAEVRAAQSRRVPVGGTTTGWQIGWSCSTTNCSFWPVGSWLEGTVDRFWWYFDGVRQENQCGPYFGCGLAYVDPDMEMFGLEETLHAFAGAAGGTEFDVTLVAYVFDRLDPVVVTERITIPTPSPAPPTGLVTGNSVCAASGPLLAWVDQAHTEEGFSIYRGVNGAEPVHLADLDKDETEFQDLYSGPRSDELTFRVTAFNGGGESSYAEIVARPTPADCGAVGAAPLAPSHLAADRPSSGITLHWRDNSAQEAGFRIYRRQAAGTFQLIGAAGPNAGSYHDSPVAPDATYIYLVAAFNSLGETPAVPDLTVAVPDFLFADSFETGDASAWTNSFGLAAGTSSVRLVQAALEELELLANGSVEHLIRPSEPRIAGFRRGGVDLAWLDNSTNEDGFRVYRKEKGGPRVELATLPAGATSYFDDHLEPGEQVRYRIEAFTDEGKRRKSEVLRVELPKDIFRSSFETADLRHWTSKIDPAARLRGSHGVALFGNFGLGVSLDEGSPGYALDDTPSEEPRLRARVLLDTRRVVPPAGLADGEPFLTFLEGRTENGAERLFSIRLVKLGGGLGVDAILFAADGGVLATSVAPLDGRVYSLEFDWDASDLSGVGRFRLWLDGRRKALLEGWSSGATARQYLGQLRLGAVELAAGGSGVLALDEIATRRSGGKIRRRHLAGHLLSEEFEHATTIGWETVVNGGAVDLVPDALEGARSLRVSPSGPGSLAYLERTLYFSERHLLASVLIDPATLILPEDETVTVLSALSLGTGPGTSEPRVELRLKQTAEGLKVVARSRDGTGWSSKRLLLPLGLATIEIEWRTSTVPGAADGSLVLRVTDEATDDTDRKLLDGLATGGARVRTLRLGLTEPVPTGVSGSLKLDTLEVWR